ncbi:MAG: hypothetical protein SGILL_004844 [Bacillariaceae sp.]
MPPNTMTANTSIQFSESTRRKLSSKTTGSGGSGSSRRSGSVTERKSAVDAALGKFTDEFDDDHLAKISTLGQKDKNDLGMSQHSTSSRRPRRNSGGSKRATRTTTTADEGSARGRRGGKRDDELGMSEHSTRTSKSTASRSARQGRSTRSRPVVSEEEEPEDEGGYEDLKDDDVSVSASTRKGRFVRTGRRKTDRERAASPGPVKKRSVSVGALKKRSSSNGPVKKRSSSREPVVKHAPSNASISSSSKPKRRSSSVGPLKHKPQRAESLPIKKRSASPGPMKKRSASPGPMKKRSSSPGALSRKTSNRSERVSRPGDQSGALEGMLGQVGGGPTKKRGGRSVASAPAQNLKRPELQRMNSRPVKHKSVRASSRGPRTKAKSVDAADILSVASQMEAKYDWQGARPSETRSTDSNGSNPAWSSKENDVDASKRTSPRKTLSPRSKPKRSMSALPGALSPRKAPTSPSKKDESVDEENELAKHRLKRNNSMTPTPTHAQMADEGSRSGPERGGGMTRAQSMMLHRETTRRGKSNSLMDLVQYKEEEIHSTSYFASNHVLVNRERMKRGLRPLTRNIHMDDLARKSAQSMAESNGLNPLRTTYVGNVLRGDSIRAIHRSTMQQKQGRERANLLNPYFQEFGVGTCKGTDGMLYMCQLFSERLELALTDTTG